MGLGEVPPKALLRLDGDHTVEHAPVMRFRWGMILAAVLAAAASCHGGCGRVGEAARAVLGKSAELGQIKLPPGFHIALYAPDVPGARSMVLSPKGTLFVGTRGEGKVYAIPPAPDKKHGARVITIASGLEMPNGVALHDGALYVAEVSRILRYDNIEQHLDHPPKPVVVYDKLPTETHHGWKARR